MRRIIRGFLSLAIAVLLVPAAVAAASGSTTSTGAVTTLTTTTQTTTTTSTTTTSTTTSATTTTTSTTPTPPPKPKPPAGSLKLHLPNFFLVHRQLITVPGRSMTVEGVVRPYVAGQWVTVRSYLNGRQFKVNRYRIKPSPRHKYGRFSATMTSPGVGYVRVLVTHARTSQLLSFQASRGFSALDRNAGFGSTGRFVQLIQQRLAALHFYVPQTGVYDAGTGLALDAYHRLLHWGTYQTLDGRTVSFLLNGWGQFTIRYPGHGRHAEGNLGQQLLALTNGPNVDLIFPISSGKPSTPTVLGNFHVYLRTPGYLPDGMYYSSFFIGGYAIHGYNPAPDYPASHGCMRLPIADATTAFNWLNYGDAVDVYY